MEIWQDGVLAGLAAVGLTALLWLLAGSLFRWRERPLDAVYLVMLTGGAEKLDMTLRELARERRLPVVLVDGGLTAEGRQRVELLTARYGAERARSCTAAEAFEVSEYGGALPMDKVDEYFPF